MKMNILRELDIVQTRLKTNNISIEKESSFLLQNNTEHISIQCIKKQYN